jgi:antitoxin component HigA of HigAB toxin-antitoxin module
MRPTPIRTELDYQSALAEVGRLWDALPGSTAEADLEHWGILIDLYEAATLRPNRVDPVEVVKAEMEMNGRTRRDLAAIIGENRATEVLSRRRALTLPMIRRLCAEWDIPADLLVPAYDVRKTGLQPA